MIVAFDTLGHTTRGGIAGKVHADLRTDDLDSFGCILGPELYPYFNIIDAIVQNH